MTTPKHLDWVAYRPHEPPYAGPLAALTRVEARRSFDDFMSTRFARISEVKALLGLSLHADDVAANANELDSTFRQWIVHEWAEEADPGTIPPRWLAVVHDLGALVGELVIQQHPHLNWKIGTGGKKVIGFQAPLLAGYRRVSSPKYQWPPQEPSLVYALRLWRDGSHASSDPLLSRAIMANLALA